jgi:hypothetical protein
MEISFVVELFNNNVSNTVDTLLAALFYPIILLGLALRALLNLFYLLINPREALNDFTDALWLLIIAIDFIASIAIGGNEVYYEITRQSGKKDLIAYAALQIIPTGSYIVAIIAYILSQNDDSVAV